MTPELISLEIRPGVYVRLLGIPWDLTADEARRVAGVVEALGDCEAVGPSQRTGGSIIPGTN